MILSAIVSVGDKNILICVYLPEISSFQWLKTKQLTSANFYGASVLKQLPCKGLVDKARKTKMTKAIVWVLHEFKTDDAEC